VGIAGIVTTAQSIALNPNPKRPRGCPKGKNVAGIGQISIVGLATAKDEKPTVKDEKNT
jgi:hypothetical protein